MGRLFFSPNPQGINVFCIPFFSILHQGFLHTLANRLNPAGGDFLFVFPHKRAGHYFTAITQKLHGVAASCTTIEEFILQLSDLSITDGNKLLITFFEVYKSLKPDDSFEDFIGWGGMLLKDFDELDRNLAHPQKLFTNLCAVKEIEYTDIDTEEALIFWKSTETEREDSLAKKFLMTWEVVKKSYFLLNEKLNLQGEAYMGMAYRKAVENLENSNQIFSEKKIVFAGFNALTVAEEKIIWHFLQQGTAEIYWDADAYYLNNPESEAGFFIRKSAKNLKVTKPEFISNKLLNSEKNIEITSMPLATAQAMWLKEKIAELKKEKPLDGSTAIVLPDEKLLPVILEVLGDVISEFNVSVGYPLSQHPLHSLLSALETCDATYDANTYSYQSEHVIEILQHPLLDFIRNESTGVLQKIISSNIISVKKDRLTDSKNKIFSCLFSGTFSPAERCLSLLQLIDELQTSGAFNSALIPLRLKDNPVDKFRNIFNELTGIFTHGQDAFSLQAFWRMYRQAATSFRLNMEEEDYTKPQLMGVLESRCLSFENLIIPGMNEGIFPMLKTAHSYIPYDLRKAYKLPTYDEQDNLYAYYFYRLLHTAKNVFLVYNSDTSQPGTEQSRYLRQLELLLAPASESIKITRNVSASLLANARLPQINISKTEEYFAELEKLKKEKYFSPTFISSYFNCSLQFYFRHIKKIQPQESLYDKIESDVFGNLFHALMHKIYLPYLGKTLTKELILARKKSIDELMETVLAEQKITDESFILHNSLSIETLKILAAKVMEADALQAPFSILYLEKKTEKYFEDRGMKFYGVIDRVDEKDSVLRVVDYKTGNVVKYNLDMDKGEGLNPEEKEAFQLIFYSWMLASENATQKVAPYIFPLKTSSAGFVAVNADEAPFTTGTLQPFEKKLTEYIDEIFNPESLITQTVNEKICNYCDYKNFCLK